MKHILTLILLIIGLDGFGQVSFTPMVGAFRGMDTVGGKLVQFRYSTGQTTPIVTPPYLNNVLKLYPTQAIVDGKVSKSGDTMTGNLTINGGAYLGINQGNFTSRSFGNSMLFSKLGGGFSWVMQLFPADKTNQGNQNLILPNKTTFQNTTRTDTLAVKSDIPAPVDISGKANTDGSNITASSFRTALGIPSGGETLQSVTDRGAITTNQIQIYKEMTGYPTLSDIGKSAFRIRSDNSLYGFNFGLETLSGNGWIQAQRDGTDREEAYNLILNPVGGNLGVGTTNPTAKLDIAGDIKASGTASISPGTASNHAVTLDQLNTKANDNSVIKTSGDQTKTGSILFSDNLNNLNLISTAGSIMSNGDGSKSATFNLNEYRVVNSPENKETTISPGSIISTNGSNFSTELVFPTATANRVISLPDSDGELALKSYVDAAVAATTGLTLQEITDNGNITSNGAAFGAGVTAQALTTKGPISVQRSGYPFLYLDMNGNGSSTPYYANLSTSGNNDVVLSPNNVEKIRVKATGIDVTGNITISGNATVATPTSGGHATTKDYVDILNAQLTLNNYTSSGNGSLTTITFTHGRSGITSNSKISLTPRNSDSAGFLYADIDATNIYIYYSVAPPSGTNNLKYSITIKP